MRAQDVGLRGCSDPDLLEWAAQQGRIVLSHDAATLIGYAYDRVRAGRTMPGVIIVHRDLPTASATADLVLAVVASDEADWDRQVRHIPI